MLQAPQPVPGPQTGFVGAVTGTGQLGALLYPTAPGMVIDPGPFGTLQPVAAKLEEPEQDWADVELWPSGTDGSRPTVRPGTPSGE